MRQVTREFAEYCQATGKSVTIDDIVEERSTKAAQVQSKADGFVFDVQNFQFEESSQNIITVTAGKEVSFSCKCYVWNANDAPTCIAQLVIGTRYTRYITLQK